MQTRTSWGTGRIETVNVSNSSFDSFSFDEKSNQEPLLIEADIVNINNVQVNFAVSSNKKLPNAGVHVRNTSELYANNINLNVINSYSGSIYSILAVCASDSDSQFDISNVDSSHRGVWLRGRENIQVDVQSIIANGASFYETVNNNCGN